MTTRARSGAMRRGKGLGNIAPLIDGKTSAQVLDEAIAATAPPKQTPEEIAAAQQAESDNNALNQAFALTNAVVASKAPPPAPPPAPEVATAPAEPAHSPLPPQSKLMASFQRIPRGLKIGGAVAIVGGLGALLWRKS